MTFSLSSTRLTCVSYSLEQSISHRGDRYIPPHLRSPVSNKESQSTVTTPYLPSIGKNSLSSFDRSALPECEDSFYTFSNGPSFEFSRYAASPSTPESSCELSRNLRLSPFPLKGILASPPSRLHSGSTRLDTSFFEHPQAIAEEEDTSSEDNGIRQAGTHELEHGEEPAGPVVPLESVRAEAANIDFNELKGISNKSRAEECSGCGSSPDLSFVIFVRSLSCRSL